MGNWKPYLVNPDDNCDDVRFLLDNDIDQKRLGNLMQGAGISVKRLPPAVRSHPVHRADTEQIKRFSLMQRGPGAF